MTSISRIPPDRTMNIPRQELEIIGQAIRFHTKRHNLKPSDYDLPDIWFCEASNFTVILRSRTKEIARYQYGVSGAYWFNPEQPSVASPDGELIHAAIASYRRRCKRRGDVYQQPSPDYSDVKNGVIILCNRYGEIARYRQNKDRKRLEFIVTP